MVEQIWDDLLSERDRRVIEKAGYSDDGAEAWDSRSFGENPLVLVVDVQNANVGPDRPILEAVEESRIAMGAVAWDAIDRIETLLETARKVDVPVAYTRIVDGNATDGVPEEDRIVDAIAPEPDDAVFDKRFASAFYGTDLVSHLVEQDVDTLVVVGGSTSGCVRASVIDAKQHGFGVVVPAECTFDRVDLSHRVALLDLWMKYAEVLETDRVLEYLVEGRVGDPDGGIN